MTRLLAALWAGGITVTTTGTALFSVPAGLVVFGALLLASLLALLTIEVGE